MTATKLNKAAINQSKLSFLAYLINFMAAQTLQIIAEMRWLFMFLNFSTILTKSNFKSVIIPDSKNDRNKIYETPNPAIGFTKLMINANAAKLAKVIPKKSNLSCRVEVSILLDKCLIINGLV